MHRGDAWAAIYRQHKRFLRTGRLLAFAATSALVVSPQHYNERGWRLGVVCPVTKTVRGYLWEVPVPPESGATGVILSDQVKSLYWASRNAELLGHVPEATLDEVTYQIATRIGA